MPPRTRRAAKRPRTVGDREDDHAQAAEAVGKPSTIAYTVSQRSELESPLSPKPPCTTLVEVEVSPPAAGDLLTPNPNNPLSAKIKTSNQNVQQIQDG